jgi:hypothetical protein
VNYYADDMQALRGTLERSELLTRLERAHQNASGTFNRDLPSGTIYAEARGMIASLFATLDAAVEHARESEERWGRVCMMESDLVARAEYFEAECERLRTRLASR